MKHLIYTISFFAMSTFGFSQINSSFSANYQNPNTDSQWTYGGNVGITLGNSFGASLSPSLGYKITNDLEADASINYSLQTNKITTNSIFGIGPSLHYYLERYAYVHAGFRHYILFQKNKQSTQNHSANENALYIGGGYLQPLGRNAYLRIGASYNLLYQKNKSIFSSGFIPSIGVVFGL